MKRNLSWLALAVGFTGVALAQNSPTDKPAPTGGSDTDPIFVRPGSDITVKLAGDDDDSERGGAAQSQELFRNVGRDGVFSSAIIVDDDGHHKVKFSHYPLHDFNAVWPHVAKALERVGVDKEKIKEARSLAETYISPDKRYKIGVECHKLDAALRSQLRLEHGLVVERVFGDSPAKKAGVKKHDILLKAGGQPLERVDDLVDSVQAAGVEDREVKLTLLREGKEEVFSVETEQKQVPGRFSTSIEPHELVDKLFGARSGLAGERRWWQDTLRTHKDILRTHKDILRTHSDLVDEGRLEEIVRTYGDLVDEGRLEETVESLRNTVGKLVDEERFEETVESLKNTVEELRALREQIKELTKKEDEE